MTQKPYNAMTLHELERVARSHRSSFEVLEQVFDELSGRYSYDARQLRQRVKDWLDEASGAGKPQVQLGLDGVKGTVADLSPADDGPVERNEFGIADERDFQLIQILERMRERLLDLSNRNPLLSYRHPKTRSLRVVAEVPAQVFSHLLGNGAMTYAPLEVPDQADLSLLGVELPTPVEGQSISRQKRARQEAERIEMARRLGIDPSYDLPPIAASDETRHKDRQLQTLLRPHELEKLLHTLHRDSITAVQESGANMLHLMFGFVEWRDTSNGDGSQPARLAPLVLLPVTLSRTGLDPRTHTYRYSVAPTGEDWSTNITLQVKCRKDFGFELPMVSSDDDNLEAYFGRVEEALIEMKGWRVRRFLTLGLVSFGKILMWRDLDATTWPKKKPLLGNTLFRGVLGEADVESDPSPGDPIIHEYPIDELPPEEGVHLPLITDADSSQHSVLVDVRRGKNLVVQGPPGTGKSQTITNLIGDALSRGKKVLFVAEKKAALDVVAKRLNDAGLAPFCLPLHSHTAQKREFLDDLTARLNLRGTTRPPREIDMVRELADELRAEISAYSEALHRRFGAIELTPFQIFWRARHLADSLGPQNMRILKEIRIEESTTGTSADVQRARTALGQFGAAFDRVRNETGNLSTHPWVGITNDALTFQFVEDLLEAATSWHSALDGAQATAREIVGITGFAVPDSWRALAVLAEKLASVPAPGLQVPPDLPLTIYESADVSLVQKAIAAVDKARLAWNAVHGDWGRRGALSQADEQRFGRALAQAQARFSSALTPVAAAALATRCGQALAEFERLNTWADRLESTVGISLPRMARVLGRYAGVVTSLSGVDDLALDLRSPEMLAPEARQRIEELASRAGELRAETERLDSIFDRALRPDVAQLKEHVTALSTAPAFLPWLLSGDYRRAVASYRAMTGGQRVNRDAMTAGMRGLLAHTLAMSSFQEDAALAALFGRYVRGVDTPFAAGLQLLSWWAKVGDQVRGLGTAGSMLEGALWNAPAKVWKEAETICRAEPASTEAARRLEESLEELRRRFYDEKASWADRPLTDLRNILTHASELLHEVVSIGESAGEKSIHIEALERRLTLLRAAWAAEQELARFDELFQAIGVTFRGPETDTGAVVAALEYLSGLSAAGLDAELERWLVGSEPTERLRLLKGAVTKLRTALDAEEARRDSFVRRGRLIALAWLGADGLSPTSLDETSLNRLSSRLERALSAAESLHAWASYQRERSRAAQFALGVICDRVEAGEIPPEQVADFYEAAFFRALADAVFREIPDLNQKSGERLTVTRKGFAEQDKAWIASVRKLLVHVLNEAPSNPGVSYGPVSQLTEEALIRHEAGKTRRHIPIRQMFRRAGAAILEMKPCFLMGPQAVAQYLAPGLFEFDLVIMDEASQMRPEDALGAIARGKQLVVVGDPKQLGPTRFFDRLADEDDDLEEAAQMLRFEDGEAEGEEESEPQVPQGASVLERSESILNAAAARYPTRLLRWHYRSKHPKLIAFSNREFYNENLIIFPGPGGTDERDGVFFRRIPQGLYEARARRNIPEARAVVDAVREHAREHLDRSLLVATLNSTQADLIDELLQEAEKDDAVLAAFRRSFQDGLEPLVVKNLENVQGDERDVIFVSVTFGKNADGRLLQYFGPITQRGGERRLNVLFTRAKYRLEVFCSFDPSDVRVGAESSRGLQVFQEYLHYAEGIRGTYGRATGRAPDSDFELAVAGALEARGYEIRCQVGVAGYFIDLGVVHPDHPARYILGVECDGATYHSSRSARDRDRLREMVLRRDFDWTLHRVWSTDWFRNPLAETNRVVSAIEAKLAEERAAYRTAVPSKPLLGEEATHSTP
jgi:hypothetical protein